MTGSCATWHSCTPVFWGWHDNVGLCPMANRIRFFSPDVIAPELLAYRRAGTDRGRRRRMEAPGRHPTPS